MALKGLANVKKAMNVDIYERANENIKGVYLAGLTNIIKESPVDEGRLRNNWYLSVSSPSNKTTKSTGVPSFNQLAKMPNRVLNRKLYFTNNLPYVVKLEYGGYPIPGGELTKNGFSLQAPNGWVRATLMKMANKIRSF